MDEELDLEKIKLSWIESSDSDFKTMTDMFDTKHYSWALFVGHLVIEKLLKAYYIRSQNALPPMIHDLRRIGERAGLVFNEEQTVVIETISQFNIRARYDDYKRQFYKMCTPDLQQNGSTK
jgi:HEPN domain-containing protein